MNKLSVISYGFHKTIFGECLIAFYDGKICHFSFYDRDKLSAFNILKQEWESAEFIEDSSLATKTINKYFNSKQISKIDLSNLFLSGTPFMVKVWEHLVTIPFGQMQSYSDVAKSIGKPTATRAVASAVAKNKISFFIPCHRVIQSSGKLGKYRWGSERKPAILQWERQILLLD
ncbi:TPA: hypothetical protein DEO28_04700 [Candidatus Dependentiae bacterium]|nr:MAG: methylated-DNA-protein-cysteine S- methyltransferase [candidate division TM6 bacterium GW2011_GWE2_31_21]KKP53852.1 MAG: methylated-DNA-protein-cysteine S- methyltransferase [candidate division TM6 bacterium GW2011_GWF2_33_332]HBS47631.1 hypothetical protein [Candidatus Dependentiae bacterium]HBZ73780.1 hypothetical protein [Candidatus Dependentiae bacterium]